MADLWPMIKAEREQLVDFVSALTPEQLDTQSLCDAWRIREVAGHVVAGATTTPLKLVVAVAANGFSFDRMANKQARDNASGSAADIGGRLRARVSATTKPPGPPAVMLGEAIVHGEDMRRPLGIKHSYKGEHLQAVADFYKGAGFPLGVKKRIAGLTVKATDVDWSTGTGPEVAGPAASLLLAMTGRRAGLDDLRGAGLDTLKGRS